MGEPQVILKRGREGPVLGGHPWILSGSVAAVEGAPESGAMVRVRGADGRTLRMTSISFWDPDGYFFEMNERHPG